MFVKPFIEQLRTQLPWYHSKKLVHWGRQLIFLLVFCGNEDIMARFSKDGIPQPSHVVFMGGRRLLFFSPNPWESTIYSNGIYAKAFHQADVFPLEDIKSPWDLCSPYFRKGWDHWGLRYTTSVTSLHHMNGNIASSTRVMKTWFADVSKFCHMWY